MHTLIKNKTLFRRIQALINPVDDLCRRGLSIALHKIVEKIKTNNAFEFPYLAGYSKDNFIVYKNKRFNIHCFLILHEMIEKAIFDLLGNLHDELAHKIASRTEYAAIRDKNFSYPHHAHLIQEKLAEIYKEHIYAIPYNLDLKPYLDKNIMLTKGIQQSLKMKWLKSNNAMIKINCKSTINHQTPLQRNSPINNDFPLIVYKKALLLNSSSTDHVKKLLQHNGWKKVRVDGVYSYNHYHSNTHEVLVIFSGECTIQWGGPTGKKVSLKTGDVIILPAGFAHKKIKAAVDFKTIDCKNGPSLFYGSKTTGIH